MLCIHVTVILLITTCVWCHPASPADTDRHQATATTGPTASSDNPPKNVEPVIPFSPRRLEKMLEKAILKIIAGDLSNADMLLLKSLNYSLEEVLAIRERELGKKSSQVVHADKKKGHTRKIVESKKVEKKLPAMDYEAFNRKAVEDYEIAANKMDEDELDYNNPIAEEKRVQEMSNSGLQANFNRAVEPHVVFKIRYDDSEIDSSSFERSREHVQVDKVMNGMRILGKPSSSSSRTSTLQADPLPVYQLGNFSNSANYSDSDAMTTESSESSTIGDIRYNNVSDPNDEGMGSSKRVSEYEGLEWVEDDVYRVIPEALNYDLSNYEEENKTIEAEYQSGNSSAEEMMMTNDYAGYQENFKGMENETGQVGENFSAYQQLAVARRRE